MSTLRSSLAVIAATIMAGCSKPSDAPTTPAVPMPQLQASIENSTVEAAQRGMSNKTWLWTRTSGPAQIHYSSADGKDYAWVVGQRRIFAGEWQVNTAPGANGQTIAQICLRHPGSYVQGLSPTWSCQPAGTFFYAMAQREAEDPLRFGGRTQALFVLDKTPANLAEVEGRVASIIGLQE
jgi:hypothetical protein